MGNFESIVRSHWGSFFAYKQKNAKLVVFSALVEQVVAIWSVATEDTHTDPDSSTLNRASWQLSYKPAETVSFCQVRVLLSMGVGEEEW